jgi:signal transduction histidine kinase/CheY-like chemotaxis protein
MKTFLLYFALVGLIPVMHLTGGVQSEARLMYFPVIVMLIPVQPKAIFLSSFTFCIMYSLLPVVRGSVYPMSIVVVNDLFFLLVAFTSSRLSDRLKDERDSLQKATDMYHGLTNMLNLREINLQTKYDSLSEVCKGLREKDVNRSRFLAGISHELRSPLSSIRSYSEILLTYDDVDKATGKEFLGIINEESERLTKLTNEILDFERMDAGKVEWHMDYVNIKEIINSSIKLMLPLAKEKGLSIDAAVPEKPVFVKGDKNRLMQVFLNLLSNAVKFSREGRIIVGAETEEATPGMIRTFVRDSGEGIYPEERDKIFDEFFRIGDELYGRPKGSGLGLSISKNIVQAHGGEIWVESEIGKGSTFFFTVPGAFGEKGTAEGKTARAHVSGGLIVVLEESASMRYLVGSTLEKMGFKTIGATSRVAPQVIKSTTPDAILVLYPEEGEFMDEIRTLSRTMDIPISLAFMINDESEGVQLGVNDYISRPFASFQIYSAMERVMGAKTGRVLIVSNNPEDARNLQTLVGTRGCDTILKQGITDSSFKKAPADLIIVGMSSKEEVYNTVTFIRQNPASCDVPVLLVVNMPLDKVKCVGRTQYGKGVVELVNNIAGGTSDARNI